MNTSADNDVVDWHLIAEQRFEDIEGLNDLVQGWDFEFHQLKAGRSAAELLQFGRPEFMLTRFYFEQPYHQRGCTALDTLTIGLIEEGIEEATTPNGVLKKDDILCFPSGRELNAETENRDLAGVRKQQAIDESQQGGFTAPPGPDDDGGGARRDGQIHGPQRPGVAVCFGYLV